MNFSRQKCKTDVKWKTDVKQNLGIILWSFRIFLPQLCFTGVKRKTVKQNCFTSVLHVFYMCVTSVLHLFYTCFTYILHLFYICFTSVYNVTEPQYYLTTILPNHNITKPQYYQTIIANFIRFQSSVRLIEVGLG